MTKIYLLEYDLSSYPSGRHITFIDGFLDFFKSIGYDAKLFGRFSGRRSKSKQDILNNTIGKNIGYDDVVIKNIPVGFDVSLNKDIIDLLNEADFILSVGHYFALEKYIDTPIIFWIIAKPRTRVYNRIVSHPFIWTNSLHQKNEIEMPQARVVYPPHNYSLFRDAAKPWDEREIDLLLTTGVIKSKINRYFMNKELKYIEKFAKNHRVVGIFACSKEIEYKVVENLSYETHINLSHKEVPKFMGNSKLFFHPSPIECAALVAYESLNAGCYPIFRRAGAIEEQLGKVGIIYDKLPNMGFWKWIDEDVLSMEYNINWSIRQGKKFDRRAMKKRIERYIRKVRNI